MDLLWQREQWLSAPFLKHLSGQQLYEMMVAIREKKLSGVMECAIENGGVAMLYFEAGKPKNDRGTISDMVRKERIVVAWMPQLDDLVVTPYAATHLATVAAQTDWRSVREPVQNLFAAFPDLQAGHQWVVLLHNSDIAATSRGDLDFAGSGIVTGFIAQIHGAFRDLGFERSLDRFTLDCAGVRLGYEYIQGPWTVIYRVEAQHQTQAFACSGELHRLIARLAPSEPANELRSQFATRIPTEYGLIKPHLYRRAERQLRAIFNDANLPWHTIWTRFNDRVVLALPKHGDATQEMNGPMQQLIELIRGAFEPLCDRPAANLVMHAPGTTVWCDFYDWGFWATRFEGKNVVFRRVAAQAAELGQSCLRQVFQAEAV